MKITESKLYILLIALLVLVSGVSLFGELMEPDAALYASIAKTMVLRNDWLNLYVHGLDWLDKPHLTFWLAAISFKLLGFSAFAYKLPSFLLTLIGVGYLYLLAKGIYDKKTALISVIIFLTSLHILISNFDVRAEGYLTAFATAAIYHYYRAQKTGFLHIVLGSFCAACAVMVKGIFVLIPLAIAFIVYWLVTGKKEEFLKIKWWLAVLLVFAFISPELFALYQQFDIHPGKVVFGEKGVSGIRFFFWDAQFGRFFNNGPIKGKGDVSFFLHTNIWAFLPWSILFFTAAFNLFKKRIREEMPDDAILIWTSAAVTFLLFSFSKFQLPHYIIIIFPQFAIITAVYLIRLQEKGLLIFFKVQNALLIIVFLLLATVAYFFEFSGKDLCILLLLSLTVVAFGVFREKTVHTVVVRSSILSIGLMCFLYLFFYPGLLNYQAGMHAARWLNKNKPQTNRVVFMDAHAFAFDFYSNGDVANAYDEATLMQLKEEGDLVIYTPAIELERLNKTFRIKVLHQFDYFRITKLKPKFINAKTRSETLGTYYLLKIQ